MILSELDKGIGGGLILPQCQRQPRLPDRYLKSNRGNMATFEWRDIKITVDDDGFIQNPEEWSEQVALALAATEGVEALTE